MQLVSPLAIVSFNVAGVESETTFAILRATVSEADARCYFHIARNMLEPFKGMVIRCNSMMHAILQAMSKLQRVATIETVVCNIAHNIAEVESYSTCATLNATI